MFHMDVHPGCISVQLAPVHTVLHRTVNVYFTSIQLNVFCQ